MRFPVSEVYIKPDAGTTADRTGPASFRRQIEAIKIGVRIEDVCADYGEFRLIGAGRLLGRCVSPDHEDKTPSMTIYTDEQRFRCFGIGCGAHGDVIDLVRLAEGCELWEAMMVLAGRYAIELPQRPPSWFARQERQAPARAAIEEALLRRQTRRIFAILWREIGPGVGDDELTAEIEATWDEARKVARLLIAGGAS